MNSAGRDPAADRVLPAHERLGGADAPGLEVDDRLVLDDDLARARSPSASSSLRSWRRSIAAAIGGSKNAKRPLPDVFAWYIARSASRISSSASRVRRLSAMPTLRWTRTSSSPACTGVSNARSTRVATRAELGHRDRRRPAA